jgi:hypothetical protein
MVSIHCLDIHAAPEHKQISLAKIAAFYSAAAGETAPNSPDTAQMPEVVDRRDS